MTSAASPSRKLKIRILFYSLADESITTAYNLRARDIASNLDPAAFQSTFFRVGKPDPRVAASPSVRFVRLPPRFGSAVMARELIWGEHDILYAPPTHYVMGLYRRLKILGRPKRIVERIGVSAEQLLATPAANVQRRLRVIREADRAVAITPHIAEGFYRHFGIRSCVILPPVPVAFFRRPEPRKHQVLPVKILFVGSVDKRKRPDLLLDFAGSLPAEKAEFHIVGSLDAAPDYAARLLARKRDEHLDHVYFHGSQTQAEVREWMWSSDLLVLPSRLEGFGRVNAEAAASGLPCVVFDDYQTPAVIDRVTGFQVRTEQEMEERLRQLVEDADLRLEMGAAAVEHARRFDSRVIVRQWETLFAELAQERRPLDGQEAASGAA